MATAIRRSCGESIDYTPGSAVAAGDVVVQSTLVGVAERDIPANTLGALAIEGLFQFPKAAATTVSVGAKVYWDSTAVSVVATASTTVTTPYLGKAVEAGTTSMTTLQVVLGAQG